MKIRVVFLLFLGSLLASCADKPVKRITPFLLSERNYLYYKTSWSFSGRLAFSGRHNSFSASIDWKHLKKYDKIELAGPFGQGRTIIEMAGNRLIVNQGEKVQFSGSADELAEIYAGVSLPIKALKYWVLGLVDPGVEFFGVDDGFIQAGWRVSYQQMHFTEQDKLPRKIKVVQDGSKLKLIIDHWNI